MTGWEALVVWCLRGVNQHSREKPVPVPLCPPEILHKLAHNATKASEVTGFQLITYILAFPKIFCLIDIVKVEGHTSVIYFQIINIILHFLRLYMLKIVTQQKGWRLHYWVLVASYIVTLHVVILGMFWKKFQMPYINSMCPSCTSNIIPTLFQTKTAQKTCTKICWTILILVTCG